MPNAAVVAVAPASAKIVLVELEKLRLLALSQADSRAVLAFPDGTMATVQSGETIARTGAVLKEVLADKLVLEMTQQGQPGKQMVWMHKAVGVAPSRIERFSSLIAPTLAAPPPIRRTIAPAPAPKGAPAVQGSTELRVGKQ